MIMGIYYWLEIKREFNKYSIITGILYILAFCIRPTSAIIIFALVLMQLYKYRIQGFVNLVKSFVYAALPTYLLVVLIDSWFYGRVVCTFFNFLYVIVLEGLIALG